MSRASDHKRALEALAVALSVYPDMRIGQLISNVLPPMFNGDPYHFRDAALAAALYEYAGKPERVKA